MLQAPVTLGWGRGPLKASSFLKPNPKPPSRLWLSHSWFLKWPPGGSTDLWGAWPWGHLEHGLGGTGAWLGASLTGGGWGLSACLGVWGCMGVSVGVNVCHVDRYSSVSPWPVPLLGACAREHACVPVRQVRDHTCTCMCPRGLD